MIADIACLFIVSLLISASTFGGGSQALFYQYGVAQTHWLSKTDLSAILAFGYASPGPAVFGTSIFIGYRIGGLFGALVGAVGIFIVPFLASLITSRYLKHFLEHPYTKNFVQGVGLAAAGLVTATALNILPLGSATIWQIVVSLLACIVSLKWRTNPLYIIVAGLVIGLIMR